MKKIECKDCQGYGQIRYAITGWNGPDEGYAMCPDCLGRGYFECPNPNDLMKNLLHENTNSKTM